MPPIILKRLPDPRERLIVLVDAIVATVLMAMAWISAGWMGYVLLDRHSSDQTRWIALGVTAIYQAAAFFLAARARKGRH